MMYYLFVCAYLKFIKLFTTLSNKNWTWTEMEIVIKFETQTKSKHNGTEQSNRLGCTL